MQIIEADSPGIPIQARKRQEPRDPAADALSTEVRQPLPAQPEAPDLSRGFLSVPASSPNDVQTR